MTQNFPHLELDPGVWTDVTDALALAAGTPLIVQNTGALTVYLVSSDLEPADTRTGVRAPVGPQLYDCRPASLEKTWARASGKVGSAKKGRLGVQV